MFARPKTLRAARSSRRAGLPVVALGSFTAQGSNKLFGLEIDDLRTPRITGLRGNRRRYGSVQFNVVVRVRGSCVRTEEVDVDLGCLDVGTVLVSQGEFFQWRLLEILSVSELL
jgi:hypothetical protein